MTDKICAMYHSAGRAIRSIPPRWARTLSYAAGPASAIFFLTMRTYRDDVRTRFHAWRAVLLMMAWAVISISLNLLADQLSWFLGLMVEKTAMALDMGLVVLWISLMISAYHDWRQHVPVINGWAHALAHDEAEQGAVHHNA